jgi:hypothetical protein
MSTIAIDASRYVYVPGVSETADIDLAEESIHQDGKRVTEASLDAEATELARHYPGLVPGGKSLSGDGSHSPRFQIRLDAKTAAAVRAEAKTEGKSVAKFLRETVTRAMA